MPQYINSKGEEVETSTLEQPHLERALAKAQREGNTDNQIALEEEMQARGEQVNDNEIDIEEETTEPDIEDYQ